MNETPEPTPTKAELRVAVEDLQKAWRAFSAFRPHTIRSYQDEKKRLLDLIDALPIPEDNDHDQ